MSAGRAFSTTSTNSTPASSDGSEKISGLEAVEVSLADLVSLNSAIKRLALKSPKIRASLSGNYVSKVKGRGMEFDEVRLYAPGDDVRCLDWRVTARTGKVHTKLYREERERPIFLVTDFRSTMFFATRGVFKSVLAAKLTALIAWSGNRHADRIGGQIFTDRETFEFEPRRGNAGILHLLKRLADLSSSLRKNSGPNQNGGVVADEVAVTSEHSLANALERLNSHILPGNLIFLFSDFRGLNSYTESLLARLTRHCDVIPILVYDPFESKLPEAGHYWITDGVKRTSLDGSGHQFLIEYKQRFQQRKQRMQRLAIKQGMKFLQCSTVDKPLDTLARVLAAQAD